MWLLHKHQYNNYVEIILNAVKQAKIYYMKKHKVLLLLQLYFN